MSPGAQKLEFKTDLPTPERGGKRLAVVCLVIGVGALLAAFAGPHIVGRSSVDSNVYSAKCQLSILRTMLATYQVDNGTFPTTEQGLSALILKPPYAPATWKKLLDCEDIPRDPWEHDYLYVYPSMRNPDRYVLLCVGRDGRAGTEDDIE